MHRLSLLVLLTSCAHGSPAQFLQAVDHLDQAVEQLRALSADNATQDNSTLEIETNTTGENETNSTGEDTILAGLTSAELTSLVLAVLGFLSLLLAHALLAPASYRLHLLMAANFSECLSDQRFSRWAPLLQWMLVLSPALPVGLVAVAALTVAEEEWRIAVFGSLVALAIYTGSFGLGKLIKDSFVMSITIGCLYLISLLALGACFVFFVHEVKPFNFVGTSVVMLSLSAVPSIILAFLFGPWQSTEVVLAALTGDEAKGRIASALPIVKWKRYLFISFLCLVSFGILSGYGYIVYELESTEAYRLIGFVLVPAVIVMDAFVWLFWQLGMVNGGAQTGFFMVVARVLACVWGERYWLMGHCGVFLAALIFVLHVVLDLILPAPDSAKVHRQRLAAEMLDTLNQKIAGADGDAIVKSDATPPCAVWWRPAVLGLLLVLGFAAETALVTSVDFDLPEISVCDACASRPQYYYAGITFAVGAAYGITIFALRKARHQAVGKSGPLLELAPYPFVVAFLCCAGAATLISWVIDFWALLAYLCFVPAIIALFISGYHRWVDDDFKLSVKDSNPAKVVPVSDDGAPAEAAAPTSSCIAKISWTVRIWIAALLLDIAFGCVLHDLVYEKNRWIGWTIAIALLVLALTIMSNQLWFGTFRPYPEQPIFWAVIMLALILWAGLIFHFQRNQVVDHFAAGLFTVVLLYPGVYSGLLAVQVLRDARWNLRDDSTRRFVRNALIFSAVVYVAFLGAMAYLDWPVALCGFCILLIGLTVGIAYWLWIRNNRLMSARVKIGIAVALTVFILAAAVGITFYFENLFGGFSAVCCGCVLLLLGVGINEVMAANQRSALQQIRVGSSQIVFPLFRLKEGELVRTQDDYVAVLGALAIVTIWGLVAAAALQEIPSVGICVAVVSLMAVLILLGHLISEGGKERAALLAFFPEAQLLAAAKEVLDKGSSDATKEVAVLGKGASDDKKIAFEAPEDTEKTRLKLVESLNNFYDQSSHSLQDYRAQIQAACCGRFHTFPPISLWQTLNAIVASFRDGNGCVTDHSPIKPREEHAKLKEIATLWQGVLKQQQGFVARLQLCLLSAREQHLWAKESEFRSFLQSISSGKGDKRLTLEDFKRLPEPARKKIEDGWEAWKIAEKKKAEEEERRRKEEEEAERKRKEEQRKRRDAALQKLADVMEAESIAVAELGEVIKLAKHVGIPPHHEKLSDAQWKHQQLTEAEEALKQGLQEIENDDSRANLEKLQNAVDHATVASLKSDLIPKAKAKIVEIQGVLEDEEEAERLRKEKLRLQRLKEEEERKRKAEEERKRKEEEERAKKGLPRVIEVDLKELKAQAERDGQFVDTIWTPGDFGAEASAGREAKTLREMCGDDLVLFSMGSSASDIHQGALGDCWYLSAIACIADRKNLMSKLFVYYDCKKGLYVIRFYKSGVYRDIAVDDLVPTKYGSISFAKSGTKKEVWVQILEKAYAKLHGSYDAIEGGWIADGLVDLSGGIGSSISLTDEQGKREIHDGTMWARLIALQRDGHLLGCSSHAGKDTHKNAANIVQGHAFSLLDMQEIDGNRLLCIRNPWGDTEWNGKWSDGDTKSWTQRMQKKLGFVAKDDGAWWMAFEDFVLNFKSVYVCRIFEEDWHRKYIVSEWKGKTAGGCSNFATFVNNPQIQLQVNGRVRLILTLEQEDVRGTGDSKVFIGFKVMKHGANIKYKGVASSGIYSPSREVYVETELVGEASKPYYIVPTTFDPGMETQFTMKVYWKGPLDAVDMYIS